MSRSQVLWYRLIASPIRNLATLLVCAFAAGSLLGTLVDAIGGAAWVNVVSSIALGIAIGFAMPSVRQARERLAIAAAARERGQG